MQAENCEEGYFVTLSITRANTTYTIVIQLGSSTNCATATPTGQRAIVTPTWTPASVTNQTPVSNNHGNTSATTIGIILGCIILGIILLLAICCIPRQHEKHPPRPIAGPPGPEGRQGAPGIHGQPGPQGAQGFPRPSGMPGARGDPGRRGRRGRDPKGQAGLLGQMHIKDYKVRQVPKGSRGCRGFKGCEPDGSSIQPALLSGGANIRLTSMLSASV